MNADVVDAELVRLRADLSRYRRAFYNQRTRAEMWRRRALTHGVFRQADINGATVERIKALVCDRFEVGTEDLEGTRRSQDIVYPRHVAMYLARELTDLSLPKIAAHFGARDHTTVHHGVAKIAQRIATDRAAYRLVRDLARELSEGGDRSRPLPGATVGDLSFRSGAVTASLAEFVGKP